MSIELDYVYRLLKHIDTRLGVSLDILCNEESKLVQKPAPANSEYQNYKSIALTATATCLAVKYLLEDCQTNLCYAKYEIGEECRKSEEGNKECHSI